MEPSNDCWKAAELSIPKISAPATWTARVTFIAKQVSQKGRYGVGELLRWAQTVIELCYVRPKMMSCCARKESVSEVNGVGFGAHTPSKIEIDDVKRNASLFCVCPRPRCVLQINLKQFEY